MANKKQKKIWVKFNDDNEGEEFWETYDSEADAVSACENGDDIYMAVLTKVGTVRKSLEAKD